MPRAPARTIAGGVVEIDVARDQAPGDEAIDAVGDRA